MDGEPALRAVRTVRARAWNVWGMVMGRDQLGMWVMVEQGQAGRAQTVKGENPMPSQQICSFIQLTERS